jgi:hypothetical protein
LDLFNVATSVTGGVGLVSILWHHGASLVLAEWDSGSAWSRFVGWVAQDFEVEVRRWELWQCHEASSVTVCQCLRRRKGLGPVGKRSPIADTFAVRDHRRERKREEEGKKGKAVVAAFESCMLTMRTEQRKCSAHCCMMVHDGGSVHSSTCL